MANYREPQWLLPNEKNLAMPASDATVGSGLAEDRHSLYSMDFDGTNDYINTSLDTDSYSSFSVSAWVNGDDVNTYRTVASQTRYGNWANSSWLLYIEAGKMVFYIFSGGSAILAGKNTALSAGVWYHIAATWDGSTSKLYINGVKETTEGSVSSMNTSTIPTLVGAYHDSAGTSIAGNWNGKLDECAIWNRALSASEISALTTANAPANILALSDKPVAYWPLGEQARRGSEWQFPNEVLQSQVFDFDGSTDYIDCGNPTELQITGALTISAWVKFTGGSDMALVTKSNTSGTERSYGIWAIRSGSPQTPVFFIYSSGIAYLTPDTGTTVRDGNWHHLVGVFNPSTSLQLYIDGVLEQENTTSIPATIDNDVVDFNIGRAANGTFYYNGEISNIAIWNSDQSSNIANIYNYGTPQTSYTVTPTAWYKLDKTSDYAGLNPNWHNALEFDGTDYIDVPTISLGTTQTLSWWINRDSSATQECPFGDTTSGLSDMLVYMNGLTLYYRVGSTSLAWTNALSTALTNQKWCNIILTRNGASAKLYLNGDFVSEQTLTGGDITAAVQVDRIGASSAGTPAFYINGKMSNIAIYDQVISAEDIKYLYNGGTPQTNISFEPTSWYKLDNLTTGIQDSGSASNNGTNNGTTEVASNVAVDQWDFYNAVQSQTSNWNSALSFVSSESDYIDCGTISSFNDGDISFSLWCNLTSNGTYQYILSSTNSGSVSGINIAVDSSGNLVFQRAQDVANTENNTGYTVTGFSYGNWHHLCGTYNVTSGELKAYVNGVLKSTTNDSADARSASTALKIGGLSNSSLYPANGKISNVAIFDTTLDSTAVTALYNNGQPETAISSSPVSWWKLDNTTTGIQDSGSASNNGTNNGATEIQTNVWTPRLNGESTTLPSTALVSSDLQFESPYSNFSLDFDGTDYINCGNFIGVNNSPTASWCGWFKPSGTTGGMLFSQWSATTSDQSILFSLSTSLTRIDIYLNTNIAFRASGGSALMVQDEWNFVCLTFNKDNTAADRLQLYINNSRVTETTGFVGPAANINNSTADFLIAGYYTATQEFLGSIDSFSIFNKALTQAEMTSIYNNGYPKDITALSPVSWWRLGENTYFDGSDFTIPNQITGAPNGTSVGMPVTALVADAPGSYASGVGSSLALADRVGDAPESTANSLSFNMTPLNKISYPAGYVPTQADNIYSMAFDGASTKITFPTITLATNYTLSAWAKRSSTANMFLFGNSQTYGYGAYFNGTSNLYFKESFLMTFNNAAIQTALARTDWVNWVFVKDTTTGTVSIYVDGVLAQSVSGSGMATINAIGGSGRPTGTQYIWNGNIDEVAIFDYALSARQIKQDIYNGTTTGKTADLNNISNLTAPVAWYRMGD